MNSSNQTYQLFIDEVPELLQEMETILLNLQEDKSTPKIHAIMRAAHSLKGGAASVGLHIIKDIAHQLEDYLKALYNEDLVVDTELENLFLEAHDCLAIPLIQQMETGNFDRQEAQTKIELVSEKLEAKLGKALEQVENYLPSSEDLGIDIIASLFEVDVAQEIRRLKGLVASPESFCVEEELTECLAILKGLSEVVDLPGFSILINIAEQALENHPDKTLTIASLLLNDLQISRNLVLNGDRSEGGNPCSSLLELAEDLDAQLDNSVISRIIRNQQTPMTVNDPVYRFFIAEVPDLLHNLETGLLALKEDKSISNINDIMRASHCLKGGAASVALEGIKNIAHKLEDYVKALFDETVVVDDELESYFLDAFDCLKNALSEQIEEGNYSPNWETKAEAIWQKLDQRLGAIGNQDYLPSSADLGIDLVRSLFEVDVAQAIKELQTSLENLSATELISTVNQQLEILSGLSEISDLPGLKLIINIAKQALLRHPEQAQTITSLLIIDVSQAKQQVLNGDRTQGGKPSPELLALAEIPEEKTLAEDSLTDLVEPVEEDNPPPENYNTTLDFTKLVSELNTLDNDKEFTLSGIPEFTELVDVEMSESEPESSIFNSQNLTSEVLNNLVEFPESDLFANNSSAENIEEDISTENIFEEISTEDISETENIFEQISTEDISVENIFGDINTEDISQPDVAPIDSQQQELQAQSYQFFIEEAVDLIALIDDNLENVLANRDINEINEVARAAHSLKGGSRSAGLEDLGMIALRVEKSLKALFNEDIPLDESLKSYLREIYQLLRQAVVARIENQEFDEQTAADSANAMWAEFEAEYGEEIAKAQEYLPSSSDLGIDIATSIFEVDVLEGITNLQQVLDSGSASELEDTVKMQIEILSGFGEMLALPGFTSICETTSEALEANPQQLSTIAQAFIDNLQIAREQVLQGDRVSGGEPSPELLTLAGKAMSPAREEKVVTDETIVVEKPVDTADPSYSFFIQEVPELLQIIENGLLTLRTEERDTAKIHEIMRAAHSLKGGAASVGLEAIKTVSHQLEDVFKVLYDPKIEVDTELETWLLESFDCLRNGLDAQIETGSYDAGELLTQTNEIWTKINTRLGNALSRADDYIPSSSDLGVDIVQSMFEVDVEEELKRLQDAITQPITEPLMGELRATLEVFAGFGEMLNLPGFSQIAQMGLQAIDKNPEHLITLTQVIIDDVE